MRMEGAGYVANESEYKHLAYTDEFRGMLREHPGVIKAARELMDEEVAEYDPPPIKVHETLEFRWNKEKCIWEEFAGESDNVPRPQII